VLVASSILLRCSEFRVAIVIGFMSVLEVVCMLLVRMMLMLFVFFSTLVVGRLLVMMMRLGMLLSIWVSIVVSGFVASLM